MQTTATCLQTESGARCRELIAWLAVGACALALLPGALTGCALPEITLETMFLRPAADVEGSPADFGFENYDELFVPLGDGRLVSIWHVHAEDPRALVVIIPGSDRNKGRCLIALPVFIPHGYDVILMDYEGFGDSSSGPLELTRMAEDGFAVVEYALTRHENVVAFGISAGGPTAVRIAADLDLAAVIVEAPAILEHEVQWWLLTNEIELPVLWDVANWWVHPQIPDDFDVFNYIQLVDEPKLIMQSVEDDVVPFASGFLLYWAAPEPKAFFEMRGGHGKMVELEPELYTQTVISWLDSALGAD